MLVLLVKKYPFDACRKRMTLIELFTRQQPVFRITLQLPTTLYLDLEIFTLDNLGKHFDLGPHCGHATANDERVIYVR